MSMLAINVQWIRTYIDGTRTCAMNSAICVGSKPGRRISRWPEASDAQAIRLFSDAELLGLHSEAFLAPAATGMFATLYNYAKLGSIFLYVSCLVAPMQRWLHSHMLP